MGSPETSANIGRHDGMPEDVHPTGSTRQVYLGSRDKLSAVARPAAETLAHSVLDSWRLHKFGILVVELKALSDRIDLRLVQILEFDAALAVTALLALPGYSADHVQRYLL